MGLKQLVGILSLVAAAAETIVVGQTFLAGGQDPTAGSTGWALTSHGISEKLFTVDKAGEIVPQVGQSVKKVSNTVHEVTLKSGYKFSDGTAVTAAAVAACFTELNNKSSNARASLGAMTVTAPSELVVRIESEKVTHIMESVLAEWVFTVYKSAGDTFTFTGPYKVSSFAATEIDLAPNTYYPDGLAAQRPTIHLKKYADGNALADGVKAGSIDIAFHLPIDTLPAVRAAAGATVKSFEVGYHYMMFHNLDSIPDVNVRKAIDLAVDRTALTQALNGGKGTRSLFPDFSPYYSDASSAGADLTAAKALLDTAGYTVNADGMREKGGQLLKVHLVAYPHRPGLVIMQPKIAEQLTALGITVNQTLTGMDWSETSKIMSDRTFDLLMWAQHTLPAGDPLWFMSAFFKSDGGNNHANFKDTGVDAAVDAMSLKEVHTERVAASKTAMAAILDKVPVSNLVTPFWHVGLSDKMADYAPYGADYFVIRPDLMAKSATATPAAEKSPAGRTAASVVLALVGCALGLMF